MAATPDSGTFDVSIAAGAGIAHADFRLWLPPQLARVREGVVLVPGSNQGGRALVDDPTWRGAAGLLLADRACELDFIERYSDASKGSGAALTQALQQLSAAVRQPSLARGAGDAVHRRA